MYYSYVEIEYVAMSFSPARMDLALSLINLYQIPLIDMVQNNNTNTIIVNRPPIEYLPD
jgi:hypothetical protein